VLLGFGNADTEGGPLYAILCPFAVGKHAVEEPVVCEVEYGGYELRRVSYEGVEDNGVCVAEGDGIEKEIWCLVCQLNVGIEVCSGMMRMFYTIDLVG